MVVSQQLKEEEISQGLGGLRSAHRWGWVCDTRGGRVEEVREFWSKNPYFLCQLYLREEAGQKPERVVKV